MTDTAINIRSLSLIQLVDLARSENIDLETIHPTGRGGKAKKSDYINVILEKFPDKYTIASKKPRKKIVVNAGGSDSPEDSGPDEDKTEHVTIDIHEEVKSNKKKIHYRSIRIDELLKAGFGVESFPDGQQTMNMALIHTLLSLEIPKKEIISVMEDIGLDKEVERIRKKKYI